MHLFVNVLCALCSLVFLGSEVDCTLASLESEKISSVFSYLGFNKDSTVEIWLRLFDTEGTEVEEYVKFLVKEKYTEYLAFKAKENQPPEYEIETTPIVMLVTFGSTTGKYLDAAKKLATSGYINITIYYIVDHFNDKENTSIACQSILGTLPPSVKALRFTEKSTSADQKQYDFLRRQLAEGKNLAEIASAIYEALYFDIRNNEGSRNTASSLLDYAYEMTDIGSGKNVNDLDEKIMTSASVVVDALVSSENFKSNTMKNCVQQLQRTVHGSQICISNETPSLAEYVGGGAALEKFGRVIVLSTAYFKPDENRDLIKFQYTLLFFKPPLSNEEINANPEKITFFNALAHKFTQQEINLTNENQAQLGKLLQMEHNGEKRAEFIAGELAK